MHRCISISEDGRRRHGVMIKRLLDHKGGVPVRAWAIKECVDYRRLQATKGEQAAKGKQRVMTMNLHPSEKGRPNQAERGC